MGGMTDLTATRTPAARPLPPALRRSVGVIMIGSALSFLDSTIVNVALRSLSASLHAPLAQVQWVVTGYLLALAAVIPVTGWAARRAGPSRLYIGALAVFTAGSALCALSRSAGMLIACRVLQGAGGGAILPAGTIIWTSHASKAQMARVMSIVGVPVVLAPMLGPTLGGLLVQGLGWQAIFWLNVPLGVTGIILGVRLLPRTSGGDAGPLDLAGLVLAAGGTASLTYGLAQIGVRAEPGAIAALGAGAGLLAAFVLRSTRIARPLLDVRLYATRAFRAASVTSFSLGAAMFGGMILMPLYFQVVRGQDVIATGLLLAPSGAGALLANRLAAPMTDRLGAGATALVGGLVSLAATVPFVFLGPRTSYVLLGLAMAARGAGIGLSLMPAMTAAYRALPVGKIPDATPQLNVLQRVGGSIGTAVFTVILTRQLAHAASPAAAAGAFGATFAWVLVITAIATAPALLLARAERHPRTTMPPATSPPASSSPAREEPDEVH
jgi:EmrB/QacA subfamily drug resistance transporter